MTGSRSQDHNTSESFNGLVSLAKFSWNKVTRISGPSRPRHVPSPGTIEKPSRLKAADRSTRTLSSWIWKRLLDTQTSPTQLKTNSRLLQNQPRARLICARLEIVARLTVRSKTGGCDDGSILGANIGLSQSDYRNSVTEALRLQLA